MITIKFSDHIEQQCNLSSLPKLPNSLTELYCQHKKISKLPELPELPKLPNSLTHLCCDNNNFNKPTPLPELPELPKSLELLDFSNNNIYYLPELPNLLTLLYCGDNPKYEFIKNYFNGNEKKYFEYEMNMNRKFINKIENWFLDCKYNPKYLYCRKRLMKEYDELYG